MTDIGCCEHCSKCSSEEAPAQMPKIIFAVILFVIGMLLNTHTEYKPLIFLIAYLAVGLDIITEAVHNIFHGKIFDENFLMSIATLGAFCIKEYPEAVMVMVLYQIGEYLQHKAVEKSRKSVTELMDIRPDWANVLSGDEFKKVLPQTVKISDIILVKTGEKIPLDGIVTEGNAVVDMSALTGESVPKDLKAGDEAISGAINKNGVIQIKVTKLFQESTVSKILELVENSASKKAKTEKFITKFAQCYTPIVVALAGLLVAVPVLCFHGGFNTWFLRALTFLVISCPCAFVIAIPLSFFAGIGGASACGILIKGSNYLEQLSKADTIMFDKTGTLTKGTFKVTKIVTANNVTEEELLRDTASVECCSNHPIAISIKQAYGKEINPDNISNVEEISGYGLKADVSGHCVIVGNEKMMQKYDIEYTKVQQSGTIIYSAKDGNFIGAFVISDEVKPDAVKAIKLLKDKSENVAMLTGDSEESANVIAKKLGIDNVHANLLPSDKVKIIEDTINDEKNNKTVVFVGDGINDAPVLMRADVGVAMGALGSDAAIEAADVVIMDDKISKIPVALQISRKTMSIVWQNIIFALGVKLSFLVLGAFGYITMWGAVFADVGVTLIAVLNSLRSLKTKEFTKNIE